MNHLQPGAVDDLVVDGELLTIVVDDEDADAAAAIVEGVCETLEQVALVEDGKTLLDIASLGHGNDAAVLADVKNTVLLEDRTQHVLDDDGRAGVGDEAGLLMELLGEQVNTEVAVLASLRGGGDADDLARAALEDQEIANADVVAGDGDGVGRSHGVLCGVGDLADGSRSRGRGRGDGRDGDAGGCCTGRSRDSSGGMSVSVGDYDFFTRVAVRGADVGVGRGVVVAVTVDGVEDLVGSFVETVTERVVVAVVVVISHITLELLGGVNRCSGRFLYANVFSRVAGVDNVKLAPLRRVRVVLGNVRLLGVAGGLLVAGLGAEVGVTLLKRSSSDDGTGAFAVLTLGNVNLGGLVLGRGAVNSLELSVVGLVLDVDVCSYVAVVGLLIAAGGKGEGSAWAGKRWERGGRGKVGTGCRSDNNKPTRRKG